VARPLRLEYEGGLYHVTARGNAGELIFRTKADYERFLSAAGQTVSRYSWTCHAYCLMGNHYHLLVETPRANLAAGMRHLNGIYAQAFNRAHGRIGHVFQGRYRAVVVEKERHLLALSRYIALNPVRAGLCGKPSEWLWSSYASTCGLCPAVSFLTSEWLLGCFSFDPGRARSLYHAFVEKPDETAPMDELRGELYLGNEAFAERVSRQAPSDMELPKVQRVPVRPGLAELLPTGAGEHLSLAHKGHGYRLNEIAAHLGIHYATVSRRLQAWEEGRPMSQRKT
jgi:putative transposase